MGSDSVIPFIVRCKNQGKGVYVLARTSNVGAEDLQNLTIKDGPPLFLKVIEKIVMWGQDTNGNVGAVVGATSLKELSEITILLAKCGQPVPLLIPGVGAQGGSAREVICSLVEARRKAGLNDDEIRMSLLIDRINSSSGINYAYEKMGTTDYAGAAADAVKFLNQEIADALRIERLHIFQE